MKLNPDYLGREQCESVKGIFILLVFFSHFMGYVRQTGGVAFDMPLGQLIVTLFLFYSGYGVMESIRTKGAAYVREMPKRRILTTLLNFDIAVLAFIGVDLLLGQSLTAKQCLLSLVAWDSVGNSNWYIFVILLCYVAAWMTRDALRCFLLCLVLVLLLSLVKPSWWYDTLLCFPAGMLYSKHKSRIERVCASRWLTLVLAFAAVSLALLYRCPSVRGFGSNVKAIVFALAVVLLTMKIPIRHRLLGWCGANLFPIYIYQRMPMLALFLLDPEGFATWRQPLYFLVCLAVTVGIARVYPHWRVKLG